jgi:hypothetical protein
MELDAEQLRELALAAHVDPRTLKKILEGRPVRGMAGARARRALIERGLLPCRSQTAERAKP